MRTPFALLLALIVALSSVTMAGARHQVREAGQITLCTGAGMVVIPVDAQGNPVAQMMPCPDCVPPMLALDTGAGRFPGPAQPPTPLVHALHARTAPVAKAPGFRWSRGPPVRI